MSDIIIPKGLQFSFTILLRKRNSGEPVDVTNLDIAGSTVNLMQIDTMECIETSSIIIETSIPYEDGEINITVPPGVTSNMRSERGDKVDNYYIKPTYQLLVSLAFSDDTPDRVVLVDKVYVTPVGC